MAQELEEENDKNNNKKKKKKNERKYKINKANNKKIIGLASPLMDPEKLKQIALAGAYAPHKTRGLQSADPETLRRVVLAGGKARAKDKKGLSEAGKKGGKVVRELYGVAYFAELGGKGGSITSADKEFMRKIGKIGGSRVRTIYGYSYYTEIRNGIRKMKKN
jgi:general stress protein YciG